MKQLVIVALFSGVAFYATANEHEAVLVVAVVNHANMPVRFVKVEVKTEDGKLVTSQFTSGKGTTEFRLDKRQYTATVLSTDVRNCLDISQPRTPKFVCIGQGTVTLTGDQSRISIALHPFPIP